MDFCGRRAGAPFACSRRGIGLVAVARRCAAQHAGEWPASRRAPGGRIAVGMATAAPMAKEVSQADARFAAKPSLAIVCTRDMTNDIGDGHDRWDQERGVLGVEAAACWPSFCLRGWVHVLASSAIWLALLLMAPAVAAVCARQAPAGVRACGLRGRFRPGWYAELRRASAGRTRRSTPRGRGVARR